MVSIAQILGKYRLPRKLREETQHRSVYSAGDVKYRRRNYRVKNIGSVLVSIRNVAGLAHVEPLQR